MLAPLILGTICLLMLALALRLVSRSRQLKASEDVLERLGEGQPELLAGEQRWAGLRRAFLRAGLDWPRDNYPFWLAVYALLVVLGMLFGGVLGLLLMAVLPLLVLRVFIAWRYQRRLARMMEQLPQLLDHVVRSLKSGRTLNDAILNAIDASTAPLQEAMSRVSRNVKLGMSLPEALHDFAELYERDELRLFALGIKVNHQYGGNSSELLENLIRLIREREQAARQLRAMTGETRMTAIVLGALPVGMALYILGMNPAFLMGMWEESSGRMMLLFAASLQILGCFTLWRMMRSV